MCSQPAPRVLQIHANGLRRQAEDDRDLRRGLARPDPVQAFLFATTQLEGIDNRNFFFESQFAEGMAIQMRQIEHHVFGLVPDVQPVHVGFIHYRAEHGEATVGKVYRSGHTAPQADVGQILPSFAFDGQKLPAFMQIVPVKWQSSSETLMIIRIVYGETFPAVFPAGREVPNVQFQRQPAAVEQTGTELLEGIGYLRISEVPTDIHQYIERMLEALGLLQLGGDVFQMVVLHLSSPVRGGIFLFYSCSRVCTTLTLASRPCLITWCVWRSSGVILTHIGRRRQGHVPVHDIRDTGWAVGSGASSRFAAPSLRSGPAGDPPLPTAPRAMRT